ncbi:MAG: DUF1566 domain-containing protein [Alphaproteobacteria bacterium]|nr:DUF1566 domain-containing protein [Alphaproteobacteria bacterium]
MFKRFSSIYSALEKKYRVVREGPFTALVNWLGEGIVNEQLRPEKSQPKAAASQGRKIGSKMSDRTIYAGISPDTGKPMYVMPEDALWIGATFNEAAQFAPERYACGHQDWRLPTKNELAIIFQNQKEGLLKSSFNKSSWQKAFYWSSTPVPDSYNRVYAQNFLSSDGDVYKLDKNCRVSIRYVRG